MPWVHCALRAPTFRGYGLRPGTWRGQAWVPPADHSPPHTTACVLNPNPRSVASNATRKPPLSPPSCSPAGATTGAVACYIAAPIALSPVLRNSTEKRHGQSRIIDNPRPVLSASLVSLCLQILCFTCCNTQNGERNNEQHQHPSPFQSTHLCRIQARVVRSCTLTWTHIPDPHGHTQNTAHHHCRCCH